ncbi:hypothetical protein M431DRAFT_496947 [Trichoderma harzianum CBS 226.95]|uniref:Uncharacterized protein n=1 Tax=Trichoderma harzianum CBS 226.95 TaxID=983964 RepID=A0A2T4A6H2_TRIHA|nr:hypothetical protein M431DRAFT_496947 [Trichoderma harzianum CBS 226.95]PTB52626.1 hypothetical protein M431DRAFT_496947 [Trichoderma harzianum CBS 226.95]
MDPNHPNHLNPHFHALDIILGYLNRGNSALEIQHLSSVAEAWCQQHHPLPLNHPPVNLDEVLWTHPFLFDLSIRSFARLNPFNGCRCRSNFTQNTRLSQNNTSPSSLSHIRPLVTAQQFFFAMIDAYTLHVGGNGRCFHDRIVAQDLKASPIIYYIPEVIHRIAALNVCELLTSEFSTFSPKTSLGFSYHLAKAVDIVMMDAPPVNTIEDYGLAEPMDIDDFNQEALALKNPFANVNARANTRRGKRKFGPKGNKSSRPNDSRSNHIRSNQSRPNHSQSGHSRSNRSRPNHNHTQSSHSHSKQSSGVKKKRKKNH